MYRDSGNLLSEHIKKKVIEELGDCLWYIAEIATYCDLNLQEIADANLDKLTERYHKWELPNDLAAITEIHGKERAEETYQKILAEGSLTNKNDVVTGTNDINDEIEL